MQEDSFPVACRPTDLSMRVVVLASLLMTATLPGRTHGLGLITKRVIEDLNFSTVSYAYLNLAASLLGALFCFPAGWWIDRLGAHRVAILVVICLALSVLGMSASVSFAMFAVAMVAVRGFGQSMLSIVSMSYVGKEYGSDRIGNAMGIFSVVMSLSMAIATGLLASLVTAMGWRYAWGAQSLALAGLVGMLLVFSREPAPGSAPGSAEPSSPMHHGAWTDALRTVSFWMFAIAISFFGFVSSGVSLFSQYVLEERGFSEGVFQAFLVIGLVSGLVANLATGAVLKRVGYSAGLSCGLLVLAAALAMVPGLSQVWQVVVYAILFGAAGGILTVVYFSVWRHAFGPVHLGKIQAAAQLPTVFASALGPVFVATLEAKTGSYDMVFYATAGTAMVLAAAAAATSVPNAEQPLVVPEASAIPSKPMTSSSRNDAR